jgi:hypothetical protein
MLITVKLGLMAKQHNFSDSANISLANLIAVVLHCYLSKDPHIASILSGTITN